MLDFAPLLSVWEDPIHVLVPIVVVDEQGPGRPGCGAFAVVAARMSRRRGDCGGAKTLNSMNVAALATRVPAHTITQPPAASEVGHAMFYGTCATLIIAVLVVLYFGEKIIPEDQHRPAVIYLGSIIGVMLLVPVLALAGFMPDTFRVRAAVAGCTFLFLLGAFGVVVRNWGHEDGRRQAEAARPQPAPVWDTSAVLPSPESTASVLTERERAGQAFGAALHVIRQFSPDIVAKFIDSGHLRQEADRQVLVAKQWMRVEPVLLAISAGYPSAAVRHQVAVFDGAASTVMEQSSGLLAAAREGLSGEERAKRAKAAKDAFMVLAAEWDKLITALHADDPGAGKSAAVPAPRGRAGRNGRTAATT